MAQNSKKFVNYTNQSICLCSYVSFSQPYSVAVGVRRWFSLNQTTDLFARCPPTKWRIDRPSDQLRAEMEENEDRIQLNLQTENWIFMLKCKLYQNVT